MKFTHYIKRISLLASIFISTILSAQISCDNLDFESGDFTGWEGFTSCHPKSKPPWDPCTDFTWHPGFVSNGVNAPLLDQNARHTITTGVGLDDCGQFPVVAPGGNYSVRLGNRYNMGQMDIMRSTFTVTPSNNSFSYRYAVVMQHPPDDHTDDNRPFFESYILDENGDKIPCSEYFVIADLDDITDTAYAIAYPCSDTVLNGDIHLTIYKPWSFVMVDLTPYISQDVTVVFRVADCTKGYHFGYAYIDASCDPLKIEVSDSLCDGATANLSAPPGATSYSWTGPGGFTASTQDISVTQPGTYDVLISGLGIPGCSQTLSTTISTYEGPISDFSSQTGTCGFAVDFTDASTVPAGNIVSWEWLYGDGNTGTGQNPTHSYNADGTYDVTLVVTTDGGCTDSITHPVTLTVTAAANFNADTVCVGQTTTFTDNSIVQGGGSPDNWSWNFGDGNTSASQHPTHIYADTGTYSVSLIISSGACVDTIGKQVVVSGMPAVDFSSTAVCLNNPTAFSDLSLNGFDNYSWNFGEPGSGANNNSSAQNPTHTYATAGTFNASLTVALGTCSNSISKQVIVHPIPVANFLPSNVCIGEISGFTDQSTIVAGSISTWSWNFGDVASGPANLSTDQNPTHQFSASGTFNVLLTVTSDKGCQSFITKTVSTSEKPTALFTGMDVCLNLPTTFTDASTVPSGTITSWLWDFGDGTTSTDQNPTHVYTAPGVYTVTMTAYSGSCEDVYTQTVTVFPAALADFSITPQPASVLDPIITFGDLSQNANSGSWSFGDGDTATYVAGQIIEHEYVVDDQGVTLEYTVTLEVTNDEGCPSFIRKSFTLDPIWTFYIPDAFTPNADGKNDYFFGKGMGILEYEFWIFDRWGNKIFHCDIEDLPQNPICWWDGSVQDGGSGLRAQQDVYVWVVELTDIHDQHHRYIGHVSVVR